MRPSLFKDKDVIFSTLFVFAFIGLLKLSLVHIPHLDPINAAFEDFEFSDIVYHYQRDRNSGDINSPIVIVGIGNTREEIAHQINVINSFNPRVIALDAYFLAPKEDLQDSVLLASFSGVKSLVVGCFLEKREDNKELNYVKSFSPVERFTTNGFINFVGEENKTIRLFSPHLEAEGQSVNSFASEIVRQYDSVKFNQLMKRKAKVEYINYRKSPDQYLPVLKPEDITENNSSLAFLKDKIVIIGAIDKDNLDDLHFTPMNDQMSGRSKPDMPGVFIHANIVDMILHKDYVNKIPDWLMLLFSVLFTYVTVVYYTYYYVEKHIWYHLVAKITQFVFVVLLLFIELFFLSKLNIRFSDKIMLVPMVLSVDLLYFYDAFVKWLHKRFGYHTYFMKAH
ncbi:MAG: CHASE2 domain-containing protein [Bacteroidetes bacterium]|nr:CHASE2 domain-containing protein [Bacteroidota bacterium]